ncbi:hypothetical protein DFH07DRAFT_1055061 [Mycena maculata]|uniref:Monooxygenase n=1 Tax=Mycena maculata TaxID=230809 RepID=A0AAD7P1M5_9AGAR|nr:hypothetical protein DFH07DRAFT_1055061 [Mycena maculata]
MSSTHPSIAPHAPPSVGAGLGGLAAVIALRREGHIATVVACSADGGKARTALFKYQAKHYGVIGFKKARAHLLIYSSQPTASSMLRTIVVGHPVVAPTTGVCAFRRMTDASKLEGCPELHWILKDGTPAGRLVGPDAIYWYTRVTRDDVLDEYKDFAPQFQAFFQLAADPNNLWQLRALPTLPTWTQGRMALLGDAAHATFPTLGQGEWRWRMRRLWPTCSLPERKPQMYQRG